MSAPTAAINVQQVAADGQYHLGGIARADVAAVEISGVDLVIVTRSGQHVVLAQGGMNATLEHGPSVDFADGSASLAALMGQVGAVAIDGQFDDTSLASAVPVSMVTNGEQQELADKIQQLQQKLAQQQTEITQLESQSHLAPVESNTVSPLDQMLQKAQAVEQALHTQDFTYVPPPPPPAPPSVQAPPPGVPAPVSLTPQTAVYECNVVGTETSTTANPGYTT